MCIFAQYKDILGVPREGIHGIRVYDFAIVDFVMTFVGACIIAYFFKINVFLVFLYLFILGEYLHILFCVDTKFLSIFFNLKKDTKNNKN
jgi:uncharacterized membrane protein